MNGLPFCLCQYHCFLAYYGGLALQGSADDKTRVWTISLTEYVIMAGVMFVINTRNGDCTAYYMYSSQFHNLSGSLLIYIADKNLATSKHFGLNKFVLHMDTNLF